MEHYETLNRRHFWNKGRFWIAVCVVLLLLFILTLALIMVPEMSLGLVDEHCGSNCSKQDTIKLAMELGRLDIVSLCLAVFGIGMAFFVIFGFLAIKSDAETVAQSVAEKVMEKFINDQTVDLHDQIEKKMKFEFEKRLGSDKMAVAGNTSNIDIVEEDNSYEE